MIANPVIKVHFCNFLSMNNPLPSPRFTAPGVVVFSVGEGLAVLLFEVFTVFTLFTLFFEGAEEQFECKNLIVKVRFCEEIHVGIE